MLIKTRPPIVAILGHVDHGKTTLLDFVRKTQVSASEAGGITQSIGAYQVKIKNHPPSHKASEGVPRSLNEVGQKSKIKSETEEEKLITFIDTPGHEDFTTLRARGGKAADIVVLVVAADDGVKPQTIEAIHHVQAAKVPMMVAINKIDLTFANPERVKEQLSREGVLLEGWGGDVVCVSVSAKTGENIDNLLEMILLVAEMCDLKADWEATASGVVLESSLDEKRGPLATLIVRDGVLKTGQFVSAGQSFGKIRAMFDWQGKRLKIAEPSTPVWVLGFKKLPLAGEKFQVVKNIPTASEAQGKAAFSLGKTQAPEGSRIFLIIKADSQGSLEAVRHSLENLKREKIAIDFIHEGIGEITGADVMLAASTKAAIYGFRVGADRGVLEQAKVEGVKIQTEEIIYRLIEDLENLIKQSEAPPSAEISGRAKILKIFALSDGAKIAGCRIEEGKILRGAQVRILRDEKTIGEAKIVSLKIGKETKDKVEKDDEAGLALDQKIDFKEGDRVEAFSV